MIKKLVFGSLLAAALSAAVAVPAAADTDARSDEPGSKHQQAKDFITHHDTNLDDKCHAAAHYILLHYKSFDTAAQGGKPDGKVSFKDVSAKDRKGRDALDQDASQIEAYAYVHRTSIERAGTALLPQLKKQARWDVIEAGEAGRAFTRNPLWFYELDIAAHHNESDGYVSVNDLKAYVNYTDCVE